MIAPQRGRLQPVGQWNDMRVRVVGPKISVHLNGHDDTRWRRLQSHGIQR
jgi:hypothetical protein